MPNASRRRSHSTVLDKILSTAGVNAATIHSAVSNMSRTGPRASVTERSPLGRRLVHVTPATHIAIRRPRDTLLLELHYRVPETLFWSYRELSRSDVHFSMGGLLPETLLASLRGRTLGEAVATGLLDDMVILDTLATEYVITFHLRPTWL